MVRADRGYRLRWLLLLIGMAGVGAAALGWALPAWIARLETLEPDVALRSIGRLLAVMWLGLVLPGVYMLWFASRVWRSGRFPPPKARVIRDTRLLTGAAALARARLLTLFGISAITLGVAGAVYLPHALNELMPEGRDLPWSTDHPGPKKQTPPLISAQWMIQTRGTPC